jgi:SYP5 family syntaxin
MHCVENNKDLDMIHDGVVRIKHIAIGMNDELDLQTKLLDETEDTMDRVNDKVKQNTQLTKKVGEKARAGFGFWIILILLIVILV